MRKYYVKTIAQQDDLQLNRNDRSPNEGVWKSERRSRCRGQREDLIIFNSLARTTVFFLNIACELCGQLRNQYQRMAHIYDYEGEKLAHGQNPVQGEEPNWERNQPPVSCQKRAG